MKSVYQSRKEHLYGTFINGDTTEGITVQTRMLINFNIIKIFVLDPSSGYSAGMLCDYSLNENFILLNVENGYLRLTSPGDSIYFIDQMPLKVKKAALISYVSDSLFIHGSGTVFERQNSGENDIFGNWKAPFSISMTDSSIFAFGDVPIGANDSLTHLTIKNDSTWVRRHFGLLWFIPPKVDSGKISLIVSPNSVRPYHLSDSLCVYDAENDLVVMFWDRPVKTEVLYRE